MLADRPRLSEAEYHAAFYAGHAPSRRTGRSGVIRALADELGERASELRSLHPQDELRLLDADLDWADVAYRLARGVRLVPPPDRPASLGRHPRRAVRPATRRP